MLDFFQDFSLVLWYNWTIEKGRKTMPSGVRDIQLLELKDTISQLNNTISTQNGLIRSLQKMLQERDAKDSEKGSTDR